MLSFSFLYCAECNGVTWREDKALVMSFLWFPLIITLHVEKGFYKLLGSITAECTCACSLSHQLSSLWALNQPLSSCHSCIFDETPSPYISKLWLAACSHDDVPHVCGRLRFHLLIALSLSLYPYILFMKGCGWWSCAILIRSAFYKIALADLILICRHIHTCKHKGQYPGLRPIECYFSFAVNH